MYSLQSKASYVKDVFYFSNGHAAFDGFTRAFNELSDENRIHLDRRLFERVFLFHALIDFQLFMGTDQSFRNQTCAFFTAKALHRD